MKDVAGTARQSPNLLFLEGHCLTSPQVLGCLDLSRLLLIYEMLKLKLAEFALHLIFAHFLDRAPYRAAIAVQLRARICQSYDLLAVPPPLYHLTAVV